MDELWDWVAEVSEALGLANPLMEETEPLPDGWVASVPLYGPRSSVSPNNWKLVEFEKGYGVWCWAAYFPLFARALAALRQDDGEVELMVPLEEASSVMRHEEAGISLVDRIHQSAVRARRVRP
jgi:hypothetical protein